MFHAENDSGTSCVPGNGEENWQRATISMTLIGRIHAEPPALISCKTPFQFKTNYSVTHFPIRNHYYMFSTVFTACS